MPSGDSRGFRDAIEMRRALAGLVALAMFCPMPVRAQQQPEARIKLDVEMVLVDATVKDKAGHVMDGLKKEDFRLDQDGAPQSIEHFNRGELPLAIALVVQENRWAQSFLPPLRYATLSVLKVLKPEDQVALFAFADNVERRVDLTADKSKVAAQVDTIGQSLGAGTNINDAVYQAAAYLREKAPAARRAIILVSDNTPADCRKGESHEKVLRTALEAETTVYNLKLPYLGPVVLDSMLEHWLVNVGKLTAETGGEVIDLEKEGSLFLAFQTILTRLRTRYTIGFYPAPKLDDGKFHKLNLALAPTFGNRGHDYQMIARTGYYASYKKVASQ
jgi:Ca-activated chloride channel homolog